jgi:hypothetical protein
VLQSGDLDGDASLVVTLFLQCIDKNLPAV